MNEGIAMRIWMEYLGKIPMREPYLDFTLFFPPNWKARVFQMVMEQRVTRVGQRSFKVVVSRAGIREEAVERIANATDQEMLRPLAVEFRGELGVDAGGLSREFFGLLCTAFVAPECKMLVRLQSGEFWLNSKATEPERDFEVLGRLVGLALYNLITLPIRFSVLLYKKLCRRDVVIEDVRFVDPELFHRFIQLREIKDGGENVAEIGLVFSAGDSELVEGGLNRQVTNENLEEYLNAYKDYLVNKDVSVQFQAFHKGFTTLVDEDSVSRILEYDEFDLIVSGIDIVDWNLLKRTTVYENGYTGDSPLINWFWSVFEDFDEVHKKKFLSFVTGYERFPVNGIRLKIMRVGDPTKLPVAHTCFFLLSLPEYTEQRILREKLLIAIEHTEGFGLK
jgi:hypothetical protein